MRAISAQHVLSVAAALALASGCGAAPAGAGTPASAGGDGWTVAVAGNAVTVSTTAPKAGVRTGEITITTRAGGAAPVAHVVRVLVASEGG